MGKWARKPVGENSEGAKARRSEDVAACGSAARKRQRTAALQNLAAAGGRPESRQRLGVRQSSAAIPRGGPERPGWTGACTLQIRDTAECNSALPPSARLASGMDYRCHHCDPTSEAETERAGEEVECPACGGMTLLQLFPSRPILVEQEPVAGPAPSSLSPPSVPLAKHGAGLMLGVLTFFLFLGAASNLFPGADEKAWLKMYQHESAGFVASQEAKDRLERKPVSE